MIKRCGYVAIVGRPNVGKSTLLNYFLGQKLSITSRKPQTTRHSLLGINSRDESQVIYVDTPGLQFDAKKAINRYMNRTVKTAFTDVDGILFVVESKEWKEADEFVLKRLQEENPKCPVGLVVNKIDYIKDKKELLPYIQELESKFKFDFVFPVAAKNGTNVKELEDRLLEWLPEGEAQFPEDQLTDRNSRFLAAEIIREKLMRRLGEELPYQLSVEIESFKEETKNKTNEPFYDISALIWVERKGQKAIVIGKQGKVLKAVGQEAREDMEALFDHKVFLRLWVKVKEGWSDDERALRQFGYHDK